MCAVVTVGHVVVIAFVILAGLTQAHTSYMQPFAPFGARGIFDGATTAFFAYIGADALANTAEEVGFSSVGRSDCTLMYFPTSLCLLLSHNCLKHCLTGY